MTKKAIPNLMLTKRRPFKVVVCIVTLIAFIVNIFAYDIACADPADPAAPGQRNAPAVPAFTLPAHLGTIQASWSPSGDQDPRPPRRPMVIHIQDAHCNYACQMTIARIIDHIYRTYGVGTVNLEGGANEYDLSILTGIVDKRIREKVTDAFVKEGLVNGAEYFAVNNPEKITLWGIEDVTLYIENLALYRRSLAHKEEIAGYMSSLGRVLSGLKARIYSKELLEFDMMYGANKANNIEFRRYLGYIVAAAQARRIDTGAYRNTCLLARALNEEGAVDFGKANNERDELIDALRKRLSRNALEEFVLKTAEFRAERISPVLYYDYLAARAGKAGVGMEGFPQLRKYIAYLSLYETVDRSQVMAELEKLEDAVKEALYRNDRERELARLSKDFAILNNLFTISLIQDDYRHYLANKRRFTMKRFLSFAENEAPLSQGITALDKDIVRLDLYRERLARFYEYSFRRDEAFIRNIKLERHGAEGMARGAAIIVTGGFHTENLAGLFKKHGIAYVSIMPNFSNEKGYESPYFKILSGEKNLKIEEMVPSALRGALAIPDRLSVEMRKAVDALPSTANIPLQGPAAIAPAAAAKTVPDAGRARSTHAPRGFLIRCGVVGAWLLSVLPSEAARNGVEDPIGSMPAGGWGLAIGAIVVAALIGYIVYDMRIRPALAAQRRMSRTLARLDRAMDAARRSQRVEDKGVIRGTRVFMVRDCYYLSPDERTSHGAIEENAIYVSQGTFSQQSVRQEAIELQRWQKKALELKGMDAAAGWDTLSATTRKELTDSLRAWMDSNKDEARKLGARYHAEAELKADRDTDVAVPFYQAPAAQPESAPSVTFSGKLAGLKRAIEERGLRGKIPFYRFISEKRLLPATAIIVIGTVMIGFLIAAGGLDLSRFQIMELSGSTVYTVLIMAATLCAAFGVAEIIILQIILLFAPDYASSPPPPVSDSELPTVTVQIPVRGENPAVILKTLEAAALLDYPDGKLRIQLIDNTDTRDKATGAHIPRNKFELLQGLISRSQVISAFRRQRGDAAFFVKHREGTRGFKAGNMNDGLRHTDSAYMLQLDADSLVAPLTLRTVMPEFVHHERARAPSEPRLAFVQIALDVNNRDASSIAWIIGTLHSIYEHFLNPVRKRYRFLSSTGHHMIFSREALDDAGGHPEDIGVGEDMDLAIGIQVTRRPDGSRKWTGKRIDYHRLAEEVPEDFEQLKVQRWRWAYGNTRVLIKRLGDIIRSPLPWNEKFSLLFDLSTFLQGSIIAAIWLLIPPVLTVTLLVGGAAHLLYPTLIAAIIVVSWVAAYGLFFVIALRHLARGSGAGAVDTVKAFFGAMSLFLALSITIVKGTVTAFFAKSTVFHVTQKGTGATINKFMSTVSMNKAEIIAGVFLIAFIPFIPTRFGYTIPALLGGLSFILWPFHANLARHARAAVGWLARPGGKAFPGVPAAGGAGPVTKIVLVACGIAVLALAIALRFHGLDYLGPWIDEATYINAGRDMFNPEFYRWGWISGWRFAFPVLAAAGAGLFSSFVGARVVTAVLGIGILLFTYGFSRHVIRDIMPASDGIAREKAALWGAFGLAAALPLIYVSRLATYDALAYFFLAAALYGAARAGQAPARDRPRLFRAAACLFAFAVISKYVVILMAPFMVMYMLAHAKDRKTWFTNFLLPLGIILGAFGILYGHEFVAGVLSVPKGWWVSANLAWIMKESVVYLFPFIVFFIVGFRSIPKDKRWWGWLFAGGAATVLLYYMGDRQIQGFSKSVSMSVIVSAPVIGVGIAKIMSMKLIPKRWAAALDFALVALTLGTQFLQTKKTAYWEDQYVPVEAVKEIARLVERPQIFTTRPQELILYVPELREHVNRMTSPPDVLAWQRPYLSTVYSLDGREVAQKIRLGRYDIVCLEPTYWAYNPDDSKVVGSIARALERGGYAEVLFDATPRATAFGMSRVPSEAKIFVPARVLKKMDDGRMLVGGRYAPPDARKAAELKRLENAAKIRRRIPASWIPESQRWTESAWITESGLPLALGFIAWAFLALLGLDRLAAWIGPASAACAFWLPHSRLGAKTLFDPAVMALTCLVGGVAAVCGLGGPGLSAMAAGMLLFTHYAHNLDKAPPAGVRPVEKEAVTTVAPPVPGERAKSARQAAKEQPAAEVADLTAAAAEAAAAADTLAIAPAPATAEGDIDIAARLDEIGKLSAGERAAAMMKLRTAVAMKGLGDITPGQLNVVAQVAPPGQRAAAESATRKLEDMLNRPVPFNGVLTKSMLGEDIGPGDTEGLARLLGRVRDAMAEAPDPAAARGLLLLPAYVKDIIQPAAAKAGIAVGGRMDPRIRVQLIDQGDMPDLVTQFELGLEILEHVREVEKDENARPSQRLIDLVAIMVDGNADPHAVLNELFKGIIKIRRLDWATLDEQRKAWKTIGAAA